MQQTENRLTPKEIIRLTPFFIFFIVLTCLVSNHIFFWDTVQLGAQHATYFYETSFSNLLLPDEFDSGHIPVFGAYVAICWKIFGKTLLVSHFAMLPFLIGIVCQAYILLKRYISAAYIYFALTLFLADPTLLSQACLITPDIVLAFLFLLSLNSVLGNRKLLVSIGTAGLILISMRGMMVALALVFIEVLLDVKFDNVKSVCFQLLKKSVKYLPALFLFSAYNFHHLYTKGWIGYHENSPWAPSFERVDFKGFLFNIGLLIWRWLDFGRIFLWLISLGIAVKYFRHIRNDKRIQQIVTILLVLMLNLSISFLTYKYLSGHRYILPAFLTFSLLTNYLIFEIVHQERFKYILFSIALAGFITGNLWIYPEKIAMGWDATLAHTPYYALRDQMLAYTEANHIKYEDIASVFPDDVERRYMELGESRQKRTLKNLDINQYVLYSNIYNEYSDQEIDQLHLNFKLVKEYRQMGIFLRLYKRK